MDPFTVSDLTIRFPTIDGRFQATFSPYPFDRERGMLKLNDSLVVHNVETAYGDRLALAINRAAAEPAGEADRGAALEAAA